MAYEINININGEYESQTSGVSQISKVDENVEKYQKQLSKYISAQTIQPFIQECKTQVTTNIGTLTGSSELQERVNRGFEVVQFGVNTYKNASAGASIAVGLGMRAGAGFGIGLALSAIEIGINSLFETINYNIKRQQEDYNLQQSRTRMGVAYNRSRSS